MRSQAFLASVSLRVVSTCAVAACAGPADPSRDTELRAGPDPCVAGMAAGPPLTGLDGVAPILAEVQARCFPELAGVEVVVVPLDSPTDTFQSNVDLSTVSFDGPDRIYRLLANPVLLQAALPHDGAYAILAHELTHTRDYVALDPDALVAFALDYAAGPITAYERQTDEHVLELGLADGLKTFRRWLYDRLDDEAEAAKRRDYYTPEEIDAWVAAHGRAR